MMACITACHPKKPPEACKPATQFTATGFFHVETDCSSPLFVDPRGHPFFSFGVNHISFAGDVDKTTNMSPYMNAVQARYGSQDAWAQAEATRLQAWGWNTAGGWSDSSIEKLMPYTVVLSISGADWSTGAVPDYFDPAWEQSAVSGALSGTAGLSNDPNLIGYFIDNEIHWAPDWRTANDLFQDFLLLGPEAPGKLALVNLMSARHSGSIASFNTAWQTSFSSFDDLAHVMALGPLGTSAVADADRSAFISLVSDQFFRVTAGGIRLGDPNHLVLGIRFVAAFVPVETVVAAGKYCDVISANDYEFVINPQTDLYQPAQYHLVDINTPRFLEQFYTLSGRPVLVSEFGWRAMDSGLPNTWPPIYPTLATQTDRADKLQALAQEALAAPWMVGYHWFEFADEPPGGRFDGENSNWGLVDTNDDPYTAVTTRSAQVNRWTAP
jgi:hypothetical protein